MDQKLLEILNKVLLNSGLEKLETISENLNLRDDLQLDSISIAELIASVDVAFDADVNSGDMVVTLGDIKNKLTQ